MPLSTGEKLSLGLALIAVVVAVVLGVQNMNLRNAQDTAQTGLQSCQATGENLQAQIEKLSGDLTAAQSETQTLRAENEQLKTKKPGAKKPVRVS